MGYTHYWYRAADGKGEPKQAYGKLAMDARKIVAAIDVPLAREYDEPGEAPEINEGTIRFNGAGSDGHETFCWPVKPEQAEWHKGEPEVFDFCKTARKPYDIAVGAILIRAKAHYGDAIRVSSDGYWDEEWQPAAELCKELFGSADDPMSGE